MKKRNKIMFNIVENENDFFNFIIMESMEGNKATDVTDKRRANSLKDNIAMQINGIEVDPKRAIQELEAQFDKCIEEKAYEIIKERLMGEDKKIQDLLKSIRIYAQDKIEEKLPSARDEEWD